MTMVWTVLKTLGEVVLILLVLIAVVLAASVMTTMVNGAFRAVGLPSLT